MQAEGYKGGSAPSRETTADADTRHGYQGRAAEAGRWQVVGEGDVQVGGASHQERRWGAGEKLEGFEYERLRMGRR